MSQSTNPLWDKHQRQWNALGSPLRPVADDLQAFNAALASMVIAGDDIRTALVLGSTPEFPGLAWPDDSRVYALDKSPAMLRYIWPAGHPRAAGAVQMDWRCSPIRTGSVDVVIGDGCFSLLDWTAGYQAMLDSVADMLRPGGRLLMRCFVRPTSAESVDAVYTDLDAGRIGGFHAFKWRLAMAHHGENAAGVRAADIWSEWHARGYSAAAVADKLGWSIESVRTMDAYQDAEQRLSFPTLPELLALLSGSFEIISTTTPAYELGERCPVIVMKWPPRDGVT